MFLPSLLAVAPATVEWSPKVAVVMIICNVIAIAIGKFTIQKPSEGAALPSPEMFGGMGVGAMLGATSLGHIIGAGAILGLAAVMTESRVDLPALGKPTNPTSASTLSSSIFHSSLPSSPGCAYLGD